MFLFLMAQIIIVSVKLYRRLPGGIFAGKGLVVIFWGMIIAFFINMQLRQMRLFMFPSALFFLMAGIICGLYQRTLPGNIVDAEIEEHKTISLENMREEGKESSS